ERSNVLLRCVRRLTAECAELGSAINQYRYFSYDAGAERYYCRAGGKPLPGASSLFAEFAPAAKFLRACSAKHLDCQHKPRRSDPFHNPGAGRAEWFPGESIRN